MKQTFSSFIILGLIFNSYCQINNSNALAIGEIRSFRSVILNEERTLNVFLPEAYDTTKSYPVVYLLDGSYNEDFLHITGLVQFFNLQLKMPETIVVGIANVDRKRDFTHSTEIKSLKDQFPTTGHSEAFIQFIEKELQPYISNNFKTNETRYLIGQSLGGLLATEILLKKPDLFSHYLIVSPSLWWDDENLLNQAPELLRQSNKASRFIYISVGKKEHPVMQKEASKLYKIIKKMKNENVQVVFNKIPDENHATILHKSIYEAFVNLFPY